MANTPVKTEHNGAKNGGGAWTNRADAKRSSRRARRTNDRIAVREAEDEKS